MESEAKQFLVMKITLDGEEDRIYRKGEFWFSGDFIFVSHGSDESTAQFKMFNIGWVKQVSLTYGV